MRKTVSENGLKLFNALKYLMILRFGFLVCTCQQEQSPFKQFKYLNTSVKSIFVSSGRILAFGSCNPGSIPGGYHKTKFQN